MPVLNKDLFLLVLWQKNLESLVCQSPILCSRTLSKQSAPSRFDVATSCDLTLGSDEHCPCQSFYLLYWTRDRSTIPNKQIFRWQQYSSLQLLRLQLSSVITGLEEVGDADWFFIHQSLDHCWLFELIIGSSSNFGLDCIGLLFHRGQDVWKLDHNLVQHKQAWKRYQQ